MHFNNHAKKLLLEAKNTHLKVKQVMPNTYHIQCLLGETIVQEHNTRYYHRITNALIEKYASESASDCSLIAFHPILEKFKNPCYNMSGTIHLSLKKLNAGQKVNV